jgi:hypothetical protein
MIEVARDPLPVQWDRHHDRVVLFDHGREQRRPERREIACDVRTVRELEPADRGGELTAELPGCEDLLERQRCRRTAPAHGGGGWLGTPAARRAELEQ